MAKLFKEKILQEKISTFEIPNFEEKIQIVKNWHKLHTDGNLSNKKEEELESPFGDDFFGKILGYDTLTENETYSRKFQPKVPVWGQKSDIGLGFFSEKKDIMKVVVELKDAKTSLDKPQQRAGNLTPVQQAFKYKPYFKECDFIIVSNFYETRLYIDSYYDFETWTLDDLVDEKNNYYNLRKFYYLLSKKNFITKSWESNTKSLLSTIRSQEKEITKKFYKEYSELRKELLKDIIKNNSVKKSDLHLIFNKTQKIIDRIIFIHFCEDLGLLPNGKLKENLLKAEEIGFTPWDVLKIFFKGVDSGSEKLEIPEGYNGGLFKQDPVLNELKVGNKICKKFINLWEYDFEDELSVNILGHIFEQSISDIEELKEKINNEEEVEVSKRKKDGVFYTPEYIVDYIVKNSVGKKIDEWEEELKEKYNLKEDITDKNYEKRAIQVYSELQEKVQNIKVLDPACGSWAFLVKVFDFLLEKNKEISKSLESLGINQGIFSTEAYFKTILKNNIYGVDLNEESVEITKLSLWLKTAQKGKKLENLDGNIKCGNSLIDDPEIAGDKAFNWEKEFPFCHSGLDPESRGFDVVVWNPPYVNIANIEDSKTREYLRKNYKTVKNKSDLYSIFVEKSVKILKKHWKLWMIFSDTWLSTDSFLEFRKFLITKTKITDIVDLPNWVFKDAVVKTLMIFLEKEEIKNNSIDISKWYNWIFEKQAHKICYTDISDDLWFKFNIKKQIKIENKILKLWKLWDFSLWIKTSNDKKFISNNTVDSDSYKLIRWRNTFRYLYDFWNEYLWYKPDLMMEKKWAWPRKLEDFLKEKLIFKEIWKEIQCVFDDSWFLWNDTINIMFDFNKNYSSKYLMLILNSYFIRFWYKNNFSSWLHIKLNQLKQVPIPDISISEQQPFIEKADFMLENNKILQEKIQKFLKRLTGNFEIEKLSKKLENFYELEFADFVKELKKKKIILTLKDQDEWEEYFDSYRKEILELKSRIDSCDREIDEMVFDLYGLDEEERGIVLGGN